MRAPATETAARVLVVDDNEDVGQAAALALSRRGFAVETVLGPNAAWSALRARTFDVILLDLNFRQGAIDGREGLELLQELRSCAPDAAVVVITGYSGVSVAVEAMRLGASDFVTKPWKNERLVAAVEAAIRPTSRLQDGSENAGRAILLGSSPAMASANRLVTQAANTTAPVLLVGEAGVGKSLAARALHERSGRASGPYVVADLEAPPSELERAVFQPGGAIDKAAEGTLVLDEPGAMEAADQARLLARLEVFNRLSPSQAPRLVTLSRRPLADLQAKGAMRPQLLEQLAVVTVALPPLRQRPDDILPLAAHFLALMEARHGRPPKPLSPDAAAALQRNDWPENARGLRQAIERAVVLSHGDRYELADLALFAPPADTTATVAGDLNLERMERALIEAALTRHGFNISQAARDLGLTRAALYRRMIKHGL